jgi:hypothetical protein
MKTPLEVPTNKIETEAEDHAEETRYAVSHHGRELHKEKPGVKKSGKVQDRPDEPWQVD